MQGDTCNWHQVRDRAVLREAAPAVRTHGYAHGGTAGPATRWARNCVRIAGRTAAGSLPGGPGGVGIARRRGTGTAVCLAHRGFAVVRSGLDTAASLRCA